jgi:hypothetical protein
VKRWSLHLRLFAAGAASVIAALALAALGLSLLFNAHIERSAVADLTIQLDQVLAGLDLGPDGQLGRARRSHRGHRRGDAPPCRPRADAGPHRRPRARRALRP